jgi:hypothetical protein
MKRTVQQKLGKKIILSLVAIVGLATINASAQSPTIYLGATLGPQYTNINSNSETFTGGVGYNASIRAEARFSQPFGLELQAGISNLSASTKYKDSIAYNDYVQRFNNNYTFNTTWAQVRLLAKYYIRLGGDPITPYDRPEGSGNYLYFMGGVYMGTISSSLGFTKYGRTGTQMTQKHINNTTDTAGTKTTTTLNDNSVQETFDQNALTNLDYGVILGAGVELRLSQYASLDFNLNFSDGLTTLDNPASTLTTNQQTANGFFLGHYAIQISGTPPQASLVPTRANATNMFIAFNIGLKFKLFGDSY